VTAHGAPVWHFPPDKRDLAERFAIDRAYRHSARFTRSAPSVTNALDGANKPRASVRADRTPTDPRDPWNSST
jgi:hypothetical protein